MTCDSKIDLYCRYFKQILMYVSLFIILGNSISEDYGHADVSTMYLY